MSNLAFTILLLSGLLCIIANIGFISSISMMLLTVMYIISRPRR
nr:MAG TPA: hypothetical protein [Caudoviricetes sp.]DAU84632.1 MAG TPA: hypothetical protein [Caudoviricetes sp.]